MAKRFSCFMLLLLSIMALPHLALAEFAELLIHTKSAEIPVKYELAATEKKRQVGLMNRTFLPKGQGMLFDFEKERPVHMWMKETLIPLDMLFAKEDGRIVQIHENATPHDLQIIRSEEDIRWVLELNAGFVKKHAVQVGDQLSKLPENDNNK